MTDDKICLTIPGALEWDGDNGTHGVVGTHSADGEHSESAAAIATLKALGYTHNGGTHWKPPVGQKPDFDLIDSLRAQLANTEQSRRSFFDLSQDLEKRLVERDALLAKCKDWIEAARDGVLYPIANEFQGVVGHNAEGLGQQSVALLDALSAIAEPVKCEPSREWSDAELTELFSPGSGNKARRRIAEIEKAKQKTCIECDQSYCHGVCVERGDQDYDRDQAAKGGDDE